MKNMDIFENTVFKKLSRNFRQTKRTAYSDNSFSTDVVEKLLRFDRIRKEDPNVKIIQTEQGYDIRLSKPHVAFDFCQYMQDDNCDVKMVFTNELLEFEPEEELIHKSKVPLWVICPLQGGNRVLIKRAW